MLLRILNELDVFCSVTYRDMPFVLAPNLWRLITRYAVRRSVAVERMHGDGIMVDFDSPESFEEVFWRTFGSRTPDARCFGVDEPNSQVLDAFAAYRDLITNPRTAGALSKGIRRRYLSKNNNNLLRLRSLCADTTATVLLVYRSPVATARSLHRLHSRFCSMQAENPFQRTYMAWLGHHEFGLDHRPFCFALPDMDASLTPDDPDYWLDYWNAVYRHVLDQADLPLQLVNHDLLCARPSQTIGAICNVLGVGADSGALARQIVAPAAAGSGGFSAALLERVQATHDALIRSPRNLVVADGPNRAE